MNSNVLELQARFSQLLADFTKQEEKILALGKMSMELESRLEKYHRDHDRQVAAVRRLQEAISHYLDAARRAKTMRDTKMAVAAISEHVRQLV